MYRTPHLIIRAVTALLCTGLAADAATAPATAAAPSYTKVMIIAEENHTYDQIIGSAQAPYLNHLAATYGSAEAMDAGYPTDCPSLVAYLIMTSGSAQGICDDQGPRHHPIPGDNIFAQAATAGLSWRGYAEHAPASCSRTDSPDGMFLVRHTPAAYYLSEQDRCPTDDVPMGTTTQGPLHDDLAAGTLPNYAYLTPDACHDMHSAASCPTRRVETADAWLAQWIPQIQSGPDYRAGRLVIIITWDEGSATSNHIPTLVISPTTDHVASTTGYTHCSTLATTEDLLHLPRLGCARNATPMTSDFAL